MESQKQGQKHGAAVRWAATAVAGTVAVLAHTAAEKARGARDYGVGFAQGLLSRRDTAPNG